MAKKKICLDSGHYGKFYNNSPAVKSYYESDMVWKLHLLLKSALEEYGFEVITTRTTQAKDLGVYDRGVKSKGCDLFLSLHSNATGNTINEDIDHPTVYVPLNGKGDELGQKLASCIQETMQTQQKGRIATRKSSSGGEYYGVMRGSAAVGTVGMILEHSYHTNTRSTNWLLKEENLKILAKNEAQVIAEYFGIKKTTSTPVKELYRVRKSWEDTKSQIFAGTLANAKKACKDGYSVYDVKGNCVYTNGEFKVRVKITDLNICKKALASSKSKGYIEPGVYTIIDVVGKWGFLKSKIGWINLDYTERL